MIKRITSKSGDFEYRHNRKVRDALDKLKEEGFDVLDIRDVQKPLLIFGLRGWITDIIYNKT